MTNPALSINNIYCHGFQPPDLQVLEKAGFTFRSQLSSYAGSQTLHFIDFSRPPCLECIQVGDHQDYLDFQPPGMVPYAPGINLGLAESAAKEIEHYQGRFQEWEPYLLHENYEGGQEERQPGWNYLNFARPVVPDTFVWITEVEQPYPATHPITSHPNGALALTGLLFDLDSGQLQGLSQLVDQPIRDGALDIAGVQVFARGAYPLEEMLPSKQFPLAALILKAKSLEPFLSLDPAPDTTLAGGSPACWLRLPDPSPDLLVIT